LSFKKREKKFDTKISLDREMMGIYEEIKENEGKRR
jgi:hypothetical protein